MLGNEPEAACGAPGYTGCLSTSDFVRGRRITGGQAISATPPSQPGLGALARPDLTRSSTGRGQVPGPSQRVYEKPQRRREWGLAPGLTGLRAVPGAPWPGACPQGLRITMARMESLGNNQSWLINCRARRKQSVFRSTKNMMP